MLFSFWFSLFILYGPISPLFSSSILGTYWSAGSIFQCHISAFSYCSWGSQGKNTEVVCHSLHQWTTFCQNFPPWPDIMGFPDSSVGKESACNARDRGLIPGSGRFTGEGLGYPLKCSWASLVVQLVKNLPAKEYAGDLGSIPGWEDPQKKGKAEPPGKPKNTGVASLSLLSKIVPTQGLNQGLLHCRQILYQLSYQGSPFLSLFNRILHDPPSRSGDSFSFPHCPN